MIDQQSAFARAGEARQAIADIIATVRSGETDLSSAFEIADTTPLAGRCFAVKVFEAVPGIGKVRARRTMDDIGLEEDVWLADVPATARAAVLAAFTEPPPT